MSNIHARLRPTIGKKIMQIEIVTRTAKVRVQKLIRLDSSAAVPALEQDEDMEGKA
jgi:hypothetical protein